jgi:hypothetical protein
MTNQVKNAIALGILLTALTGANLLIGYNIGKIDKAYEKTLKQPVIIWNDDEESIPEDGSTVKIEKTVNDTIYIGNVE